MSFAISFMLAWPRWSLPAVHASFGSREHPGGADAESVSEHHTDFARVHRPRLKRLRLRRTSGCLKEAPMQHRQAQPHCRLKYPHYSVSPGSARAPDLFEPRKGRTKT
jgi:hypothetical protein